MSNGFNLNEEELLATYREAKDLEVERLLTQYGSSLSEIREMYPQLTGAIKQRQLTTAFPTQPLFFTASEAMEMGLSGLQEGWMLKMTPTEGGGYTSSFITPTEWEISEGGVYTAPSGEQYTRADMEALLSMPTGGLTGEMPATTGPLTLENLTEKGQELYQAYQEGGGELDVAGWFQEKEQKQLETEEVFGKVFPEQDIAEVLSYIETNPEGFLVDMREIGRTPDTEALLKALFPEITQEDMYQVFGSLPEVKENKWKNVLDALWYGAMTLVWFPTVQAVTSVIPQAFVSFFRDPEVVSTVVLEGVTPEKIVVKDPTTGKMKFAYSYGGQLVGGLEEINFPIQVPSGEALSVIGDASAAITELGQWAKDAVATFQQKYKENNAQTLDWLVAHPELQPPKEWEGGVIDKIKENPRILLDPAYIAYIGAQSAAYTAAFMGTSLVVGTLTGNPVIGMLAGWALTTPAQIGSLYEDLLANGATEYQASSLAVPIGAVINSVEMLGDLPFLQAVSPQFARAFTRNIQKEVVTLTMGQIVKKGLTTITNIEISETLEEVIQQAIQNATVATINENRSLLEGLDEATIQTLIATLPLAIFGGGTQTAHLYAQFSQQQKAQITETIGKLTANGVPAQQAELVAIGQIIDTPEGKEALQRAVGEVSELPEIKRQAETALNKIQSTNPDLVVPAGGNMGLGVKAPITDPFVNTPEALLMIPTDKEIIDGLLIPNWIRTALKATAKIPVIGKIQKAVFGWRVLINKESQLTEDIVGRGAVVYGAITRIGGNASKVMASVLRNTIENSVKYFGFNKSGYSANMANKLLSQYESERKDAGTLEHVFTHPEMYNWTKMDKGLQYVALINRINKAISALLQKEGVARNTVNERWIHRVVTGKTVEGEVVEVRGKPGVTGRKPGAVPSYKKPRPFKTMAEGIQAGIEYEPNIEVSVGTYIEEAFKEIAGEKFGKFVEEFGVTPTERLLERFPEIAERAELTKEELADAARLQSVINRAKREEKIPEQTLVAMEKRFPELGRKLRALIKLPTETETELRKYLSRSWSEIKDLQAAKAIPRIVAEPLIIPDEQKLRQAFGIMEYEDRLAYRNTMATQLQEIGEITEKQEEELEGVEEFLRTDPVASYKAEITITKRTGVKAPKKVALIDVLKEGQMPETLTKRNAQILLMGRELKPGAFDKAGNVRWEYIIDELAGHFGMGEQELVNKIEQIADTKERVARLRFLIEDANRRAEGIKRMLGILEEVEGRPEVAEKEVVSPEVAIPTAEVGMPEAGLQQDIFGYQAPVFPKGKGEIVQISMDDYNKLIETYEKAGLPPPNVNIKPKIEGVSELSGDTTIQQVLFTVPEAMTAEQRKAAFNALAQEAKALVEARKAPYWQARAARAAKIEIVRQPGIEEGFLPMPFAGGKIYNQDFIDACNKFFGVEKGNPGLKITSDAAGILRITKAALDFSAMMIQGLTSFGMAHLMLLRSPRIGTKLMGGWYKALGESTAAFFNPSVFYGYMAKNQDAVLQRVSFLGSSRAIDYFEALRGKHGLGRIASWTLGHIPLDPFGRAELSFYSAGEIVRNEFWRTLSPKAIKQGKGFELARHLDLLTGLAQAEGVPLTVRQLESSFMWFAPNYTRACLALLADIFRGGYTGAMAKQALGGMMLAVPVYYMGIQMAIALLSGKDEDDVWEEVKAGFGIREDPITHEVTWRPDSHFLSIKIGNYYFGPGGFWYGLVRLIGNISECINEIGDKERIDLVKILAHGGLNKDNPFVYWWYTRSSPLVGTGFDLATGKDFLDYPIETPWEYAKYILTRFEPIWMEQGLNWLIPGAVRDYEIPEGAAQAVVPIFEIFGWRSNPETSWVKFYDKAKEYIKQIPRDELDEKQIEAWEAGKLGWGELTKLQKQNLLTRYPELAELYDDAQNDSKIRETPEWEAYTNRIDEERTIYYDRIDELTRRLQAGEIDTTTYRELASEAGQNYGSIIESISRDPTYRSIFEYFDKKEAEGSKYEFRFDLALAEYDSQIRFAGDPGIYLANGDYNWNERDRRINTFIEKWGEDLYNEILDYIAKTKEEKGLNPLWVRKGQDSEKLSRDYWNLPYKPIMEMTEQDFADGNIPAEYYNVWKAYQGMAEVDKEGFVTLHPELAKDWRAEYRKANPEADAMLALWGYGGRLQTMEAYNLLKQWGTELGIPLSQMGLGLPPQTLVADYFDYNKLATQFSGNSAESKLWKLQHPGFTNWAMENWNWTGTEDFKGIEYYQLQIKWRDMEAQYSQIEGTAAKAQFLTSHPEFRDDRRRIEAMDYEIPEDYISLYVQYYQMPSAGYDQERFLANNQDYYKDVWLGILGNAPKDFSKIPTVKEEKLLDYYDSLSSGAPRLQARCKDAELDAALVKIRGLEPAYGTSRCG